MPSRRSFISRINALSLSSQHNAEDLRAKAGEGRAHLFETACLHAFAAVFIVPTCPENGHAGGCVGGLIIGTPECYKVERESSSIPPYTLPQGAYSKGEGALPSGQYTRSSTIILVVL